MTFTPNELVWYNEGGDMQSGGYSVDSLFKTLGITPISNIDNTSTGNMTGGGSKKKQANMKQVKKVSELFGGGMAVPAGLSLLNEDISTLLSRQNNSQHGGNNVIHSQGNGSYSTTLEGGGLIPESLFDKLTKLVSPDNDNTGNTSNTSNTTKSRRKNKNTKKKTNNRSSSKNGKPKRKTKRRSNA